MRKLFIFFLTIAANSFMLNAQTFKCDKQDDITIDESLMNKSLASVSFVSAESGWTIEYVNKNIVGDKRLGARKQSGNDENGNKALLNIYEFVFNVSEDPERTFIISKIGSPISIRCVAKGLAKGNRVVYRLEEEADDLMRIETQANGNFGVYPQEGKACVEITTTLDILEVNTGWPKTETKSANGARVINVIMDVGKLSELKEDIEALQSKSASMEEAGDYQNLETVDKQLEEKEKEYGSLSDIVLGGKGIKSVSISTEDINQKEKRRYAVIAITESFESLLAYAKELASQKNSHTDYGYYEAVMMAYKKAIEHKDAPLDKIEALQNERNSFAALRKQFYLMGRALELAKKAEAEQGFESEAVYKNLSARLKLADIVADEHPEIEGVDEIYASTLAKLEKHPMSKNKHTEEITMKRQVLSGKVIKGASYLLNPQGMRIFAVRKEGKIKESDRGAVIGKIGQDGTFRVVLKEPTPYIYIEGEKVSRAITEKTRDMGTLVLESR